MDFWMKDFIQQLIYLPCKYFCKVNISREKLSDMMNTQEKFIKEKLVDYIVFRKFENEK